MRIMKIGLHNSFVSIPLSKFGYGSATPRNPQ
jgi:hypothetical protein